MCIRSGQRGFTDDAALFCLKIYVLPHGIRVCVINSRLQPIYIKICVCVCACICVCLCVCVSM